MQRCSGTAMEKFALTETSLLSRATRPKSNELRAWEIIVSVDLRQLLCRFLRNDDRESSTAFFLTPVPSIAPLAYLHVVFKPIARHVLKESIAGLEMPSTLIAFFEKQNGAILLSGALNVYGVHPAGQLLKGEDEFS